MRHYCTYAFSARATERLATADDAYIEYNDAAHTWTVANRAISVTVQVERGHESRLIHLTNAATGD